MTKSASKPTETNATTKDQPQKGVHNPPTTKVKVVYREHCYRMRISAKSINPVYHPQHPRLEALPKEEVEKIIRILKRDAATLNRQAEELQKNVTDCYLNQEGDVVKGLEHDWLLTSVRADDYDPEEATADEEAEEPAGEERSITYEPVFGQL